VRAALEAVLSKIRRRRAAYRETFAGPVAQIVLADLARFCRANESTFHEDPRVHAVAEGRREVWLRIVNHSKLTEQELLQLLHINLTEE